MTTYPIVESGLFFGILIGAVGFSFGSFAVGIKSARAGLRILGMALFCVLSIIVGSGNEVAITTTQVTTNVQTGETWNETDHNVILPGGTDSAWMGWIFSGLAMFDLVILVKEFGFGG
jgi:hypothetical protein